MLSELNLTGGYISAGEVPDVRLGQEGPAGSQGPSSELGRVSLGPPGSTGLVRLEEEEAGLLRFSEAPRDSELRLGISERSPLACPTRPWAMGREGFLTGKGGGRSSLWLLEAAGTRLVMVS